MILLSPEGSGDQVHDMKTDYSFLFRIFDDNQSFIIQLR